MHSRHASLRAAAALLATVVAAACGAPRSATSPAPARVGGVDVSMYARLLQMADERRVDSALVRRALHDGASPVRVEAARAVGQVHGRALAGELRALLGDRDTSVAATAAFALGLLRDTASVRALAAALEAPPTVAVAAARALGRIGAPAGDRIVAALAATGRDPRVTAALLLAAASLRPVPVPAAVPFLASRDSLVRWSAAYVIARPLAPAGVRAVAMLARDPSGGVRALVARALSERAAGDSLRSLALVALDTLARDGDPHVRIEAVRALGTYGAPARDAVVAALGDADANVRITAAQGLDRVLGNDRAAWMRAWRGDTSLAFRRSVLISAMRNDVVLPAAEFDDPDSWGHHGDWRYRAAVADAGAAAPSMERMREIALPFVRDPDGRVRVAAYAAMAPHADTAEHHPWRRQFMYVAVEDWDTYVRALAIQSLTGHATADEARRVLRSWPLEERDSVSDARVAAVQFFASAWRRDSAAFGDSLTAAIRALPAPSDPLARAAAADVPLFAAWRQAPVHAGRPLAWYEERVRTLVLPALAGHQPHAVINSVRGPIELELFAVDAPLTVDNFLTLARDGSYTHLAFHRVVPDFVAQDGDRRGDGNGGPAYTIRDELNRRKYDRGAVGMALSGPDTGGSQYFLTLSPQPHLDGGYTVFGRVVRGLDAMDALVQGDSIRSIEVR